VRRRGAYRMLQPVSPLWQCSPPPQGLQRQPQLTVRGCSMCTGAGCSQSGLSRWSGRRCRPPIMGLLWLWSPRAKVWSSIAAISKQLHNSSTERPECPLGVCVVTKAPQISWNAFHRRTRLGEPVPISGISCSRDRLRWTTRRVMTSKYVPPAQPDPADQLPPNWPPAGHTRARTRRLRARYQRFAAMGLLRISEPVAGHVISAYALRRSTIPR